MKRLYHWLPLLFFISLSSLIQSHLFLERDVIYLSNAANLLLHGGTYSTDFFETNPPMILFLYMPALFITKMTLFNLVASLRLYVFLLAFLSMGLCYASLKKILKNPMPIFNMLAFVLLLLPASQFAQREHLLIILTMPYLFAAALRLQHKPISLKFAIAVGLLAGLGFSIKPHFLTTFILIESYFIWKRRHWLGWMRTESILIIVVLMTYFLSIELFFSDYIHVLLPFIMRHYVSYIQSPWFTLLTLPTVDFCLFIGVLYFFIPRQIRYTPLYTLFFLALVGFTLSLMLSRTPWYFHVLPALSIACLLGILILLSYVEEKMPLFFLIPVTLILFFIPLYFTSMITLTALKEKNKSGIHLLIQFFNQRGPSTYTAYSLSSRFLWLVNYTPANYIGRFSLFWWQPSLFCSPHQITPELAHDRQWMIDLLADELILKKPHYVLVDTLPSPYCSSINFNYLKEFTHDPRFGKAWHSYRYVNQLDGYKIYVRTPL